LDQFKNDPKQKPSTTRDQRDALAKTLQEAIVIMKKALNSTEYRDFKMSVEFKNFIQTNEVKPPSNYLIDLIDDPMDDY